jgi:tetratricopeptide (TPR) repeat protein
MKRRGIFMAALAVASMSFVLPSRAQEQKKDAQTAPAAPPAPAAPATGKRAPQAKTQPEFDAYNAAVSTTVPATLEKAADDFAQKYPTSELQILLYKQAMRSYQNANDAEKTVAMGRKVLALDGDDPEALVDVAQALGEHTRETDLDKDQRYAEAIRMAEKALKTVDTDLAVPLGTPQDKIDEFKGYLRSSAYTVLGTIYFNIGASKDSKEDYVKAEDNLRKSIDALPSQPDPVSMLRLSIALDKQGKYTDALEMVNKVVAITKEGTPVGDPARREQDRLQKLTANSIK